ncbi:hypothetical protein [Rhizobium leguminosarum]|uniref:hypothetical protein n=1 Tax=Rhizobium leguminosarum TaxID=384 RepID=UPI001C937FEC|nr:hypothetical protein [Rhizobium leguminosarum]
MEATITDSSPAKRLEGFSLVEIDQLYAFELSILCGYLVENGRIRVSYDVQIVERGG